MSFKWDLGLFLDEFLLNSGNVLSLSSPPLRVSVLAIKSPFSY